MAKYTAARPFTIGKAEFKKGDPIDPEKLKLTNRRVQMMLDSKKIKESDKAAKG